MTFLGCTVNVENGLTFCVDESCYFERLDAIIRPPAVVFTRVLAVEKCRVDGGVIARVVQLR